MKIKGIKYVVICLTDPQRQTVEDFLGVNSPAWVVATGNGNGQGVRYAVEFPGEPMVKKMYLTDGQKREIVAENGGSRDYVELKKGSLARCGLYSDH